MHVYQPFPLRRVSFRSRSYHERGDKCIPGVEAIRSIAREPMRIYSSTRGNMHVRVVPTHRRMMGRHYTASSLDVALSTRETHLRYRCFVPPDTCRWQLTIPRSVVIDD